MKKPVIKGSDFNQEKHSIVRNEPAQDTNIGCEFLDDAIRMHDLPLMYTEVRVVEHGKEIGVNGKNLAVVGNSVGGNMTAAVVLMAKEKKGPAIKLQVLLWPVTDANFETGSYIELGEGRFLTKNMMMWFWDNYLPDKKTRNEIYASPLQASLEQLKGLPPALIQTAENDVLRDEGEAYARKLNEAGVPVALSRQEGLIHDYGLLNPLANIPAVKTALLHAAATISKLLGS